MHNTTSKFNQNEVNPGAKLLVSLGIVLIMFVFSSLIGLILLAAILGVSLGEMSSLNAILEASPNRWGIMIATQGLNSFLLFIGSAFIFLMFIEKKTFSYFNIHSLSNPKWMGVAFVIQLVSLPFNGSLQAWNKGLRLPAFMADIEKALKSMETQLEAQVELMLNFDSFWQLIPTFLVIAVIAGIGEELIFRGIIQRKLLAIFGNHHAAIWVAAIIFSAIHFQFYGFFPRVFLGAMFGYFYYWSGNIWVPIACHIFNNGLALFIFYGVRQKAVSQEFETMENVPIIGAIASLVLTVGLMYVFQKNRNESSLEANA
ncbi:MAG: lysostaphin resistance A-like protein [Leadbetterella sp.]